jgi:hypothetical protein
VLDRFGFGEVGVDEGLEFGVQLGDGDVETHVVLVELGHPQVKEILASLFLEIIKNHLELANEHIHFLEIVLAEIVELLYVGEHLNELLQPLHKHIKLIENLGFREIESLSFGHLLNLLLGNVISLLILAIKLNAAAQDLNNLGWGPLPHILTLILRRYDLLLTVLDHLVGDFDEEPGHFVGGVVETGDSVDHLDGVHQGGERVDDLLWCACVQGLDEFL